MSPTGWTVLGLVLTMVGVLLLFRFGMPYRLRPAEGDYIVTSSVTKDPWDTAYSVLGWIGLACVLIGTGCQIAGAVLASG